jgi:hypothetical protein
MGSPPGTPWNGSLAVAFPSRLPPSLALAACEVALSLPTGAGHKCTSRGTASADHSNRDPRPQTAGTHTRGRPIAYYQAGPAHTQSSVTPAPCIPPREQLKSSFQTVHPHHSQQPWKGQSSAQTEGVYRYVDICSPSFPVSLAALPPTAIAAAVAVDRTIPILPRAAAAAEEVQQHADEDEVEAAQRIIMQEVSSRSMPRRCFLSRIKIPRASNCPLQPHRPRNPNDRPSHHACTTPP